MRRWWQRWAPSFWARDLDGCNRPCKTLDGVALGVDTVKQVSGCLYQVGFCLHRLFLYGYCNFTFELTT